MKLNKSGYECTFLDSYGRPQIFVDEQAGGDGRALALLVAVGAVWLLFV